MPTPLASFAPTWHGWNVGRRPEIVVAIPAKDEEALIGGCLAALGRQERMAPGELAALVLLNNTSDGSLSRIAEIAPRLGIEVRAVELALPPAQANAGWARRLAVEAAAAIVAPDGILMTTDADGQADAGWAAANRDAIRRGVAAVAGYVTADWDEMCRTLPQEVLDRGAIEWEYQHRLMELEALADPVPHDPWPRHNQNCGASIAVTRAAWKAVGGVPPLGVGEDRALFDVLRAHDLPIRHSRDAHVVVSARTIGRAYGGMADALRQRGDPDYPCDDILEEAVPTLRRGLWRAQLREDRAQGRLQDWPARLGLPMATIAAAMTEPCFGTGWHRLEEASPRLAKRLVTARTLPRETRRIERLLARLRPSSSIELAA